jgi:hypothetical protein
MRYEGIKPIYINSKTQQRTEQRPVCARESIKMLLQVIDDIFNDRELWRAVPGVALRV